AGGVERRVDEGDGDPIALVDGHVADFLVELRRDLIAQREKVVKHLSPFGKLLARSAEQQDAQRRRDWFVHERSVYDGLSWQLTVGGRQSATPNSLCQLPTANCQQ